MSIVMVQLYKCTCTKCEEPGNDGIQLNDIYKEIVHRNFIGMATYSIIPEYRQLAIGSYLNMNSKSRKYTIYGTSKCNVTLLRKNYLNSKSTCPWHVYLDYDVNRIPQAIAKVRCTCTECFIPHNRRKSGICEQINSFIPVIRRICDDFTCKYNYSVSMETVPVGCTCKRNKMKAVPNAMQL